MTVNDDAGATEVGGTVVGVTVVVVVVVGPGRLAAMAGGLSMNVAAPIDITAAKHAVRLVTELVMEVPFIVSSNLHEQVKLEG